ncbi:preprotein translocase subunit YajC [Sphingomonas prati]|jgi:preprotein translocase subunit YajC|uniref:Sec translocon accessory complex subunit YajC n=1 Tax=Sphingomonas prati TaxID=1843237 RepID=A0A7W9BSX3_9SPHN|nr:preprotein translocase subunit YajC [Sphingomonas prati]MBB5729522.1 preprotein translocase subunit YajC [Sphingomonas prati]GGE76794.1 preprotein translocase subunit YajC [Sphingomonas prati]
MFASPAYAQAAGAPAAGGGGLSAILLQAAPLLFIFVIFYFLLIRPQQTRMKAHRALVEGVRRNDTVVTAGGLIGKVTKVDEAEVEVEIAPNTRVRVIKATLTEVRQAPGSKPAND